LICTRSRTPLLVAEKRCTKPLEIDAPNKMNIETNNSHFETKKLDFEIQTPKPKAEVHSRIR